MWVIGVFRAEARFCIAGLGTNYRAHVVGLNSADLGVRDVSVSITSKFHPPLWRVVNTDVVARHAWHG
ncbi:hypothetical protein D3C86_1884370 [compost metagenome]